MAWAMVGGAAVGALGGIAGDRDANNEAKGTDVENRNDAYSNFNDDTMARDEYLARTSNARDVMDWQADNTNATLRSNTAQNMYGTKYEIAQRQQNYDALTAEFGDMASNISNHFRTLSPSSMKAQNNEKFNKAYALEMQSLGQNLTSQGVNPGSGLALALRGMVDNNMASDKIMANMNVESNIAQQKMNFLDSAVTNPLYQARPIDFEAGMLTDAEKEGFVDTNPNNIGDKEAEGWDVTMPFMEDMPTQSGGGLLGAASGALGGLFG